MKISLIIEMILIGAFTGVITGLTGASGNMVIVPLVNLLLGFSIHEAIGTSLMITVISSLAISVVYFRHDNIDIKAGIWIAAGSVVGAQAGTKYAINMSEISLGGGFGIFMAIIGIVIWNRGINHKSFANSSKNLIKFETKTQKISAALILGFFVGIMTGIFGSGGGAMILLILIFILDFPIHLAIGTASLLMTITACSGAVGYAIHGNIQSLAGLIIGISAAISGVVSAIFANKVNEQILSKAVGVVFFILGIFMTVLFLPRFKL